MTTGKRLAAARALRRLVDRYSMFSDDKRWLLALADELELEGLESAVEEQRVGRAA